MLIHQKILSLRTATSFLLCIVLSCSCNQQKKVSMIVYSANSYTVDSAFSTAEAMAIEELNDELSENK